MNRKQTYFHLRFFLFTLQIFFLLHFLYLHLRYCLFLPYRKIASCSSVVTQVLKNLHFYNHNGLLISNWKRRVLQMIIKNTFVQISILQQQGSFAEWMNYEKALFTIQIIKIIQIITMIKFNFLENIKLQ